MSLLSATVLLFLVLDPFGNNPFFLFVLKDLPENRRSSVIVREMLVALAILVAFLFGGQVSDGTPADIGTFAQHSRRYRSVSHCHQDDFWRI